MRRFAYNSGWLYRNDHVDIERCTDAAPSNGYSVGWIDPGEWMKYTVQPAALAGYQVLARVAANSAGGSFYIEVGGSNVSGSITVPATGGWQTWRTIPCGTLSGPRLLTSLKFVVLTSGFNLNWIELRVIAGTQVPFPSLTAAVSGTKLLMSWPASSADYSLYSAANLEDAAATDLGQIIITVPIKPEPRFSDSRRRSDLARAEPGKDLRIRVSEFS